MAFNPRDVYDAAALYDMWLNCSGCPSTFDFEPNRPIGLEYYHDIGQQAKRDGWVVSEQIDAARPEEQTYLVLCPCCAGRLGLSPDDIPPVAVSPAIDEICHAMAMAEKDSFAA